MPRYPKCHGFLGRAAGVCGHAPHSTKHGNLPYQKIIETLKKIVNLLSRSKHEQRRSVPIAKMAI
eukprot:5944559-Amphidinium_carterae.1